MATDNTNRLKELYFPESSLCHFVKSISLDKQALLAEFLNALSADEFARFQKLSSSMVVSGTHG
jgi:hypothetical protein